jgi:hypothetical protein
MLRVLKALPLTLALASLAIFAASCGSGNSAKIRVVHAIADAGALDVDINGVKEVTDITFDSVMPTPPSYVSVPTGSDTIEAFVSGNTANPIIPSTNISLGGSTAYTVVLGGRNASPIVFDATDNNTVPTTGDVEFRIINAAPDSPGGIVDVYIVPPGTLLNGLTPNISGLAYTQASTYVPLTFANAGYEVIVTANGNQTADITQNYVTATGSITTLVLVDNPGGGSMAQIPLQLDDLQ